jgi:hypothetical protein
MRHSAHIACVRAWQPYVEGDWENAWVHITNHGRQRAHPRYCRERQTVTLESLLASTAPGGLHDALEPLLERITRVVGAVFAAAVGGRGLLPMPNAFELFGVDLVVTEDGRLYVLEVRRARACASRHDYSVTRGAIVGE